MQLFSDIHVEHPKAHGLHILYSTNIPEVQLRQTTSLLTKRHVTQKGINVKHSTHELFDRK